MAVHYITPALRKIHSILGRQIKEYWFEVSDAVLHGEMSLYLFLLVLSESLAAFIVNPGFFLYNCCKKKKQWQIRLGMKA